MENNKVKKTRNTKKKANDLSQLISSSNSSSSNAWQAMRRSQVEWTLAKKKELVQQRVNKVVPTRYPTTQSDRDQSYWKSIGLSQDEWNRY